MPEGLGAPFHTRGTERIGELLGVEMALSSVVWTLVSSHTPAHSFTLMPRTAALVKHSGPQSKSKTNTKAGRHDIGWKVGRRRWGLVGVRRG